jgi:transposase-like protein
MKNSDTVQPRREVWRERIQQQEKSGLSVRVFCQSRGLNQHAFYQWRRRFAQGQRARFALVETNGSSVPGGAAVELVLGTGDRLQIAAGVDATTLRTVLAVLREGA